MFSNEYESDNKKFCLYLQISCKNKARKRLRVWAEDLGKRNSKYADRDIFIEGNRTIHFNFPVSPKKIFIGVRNADQLNDPDIEVVLIEGALKTYNIDIDAQAERFLKLAIPFCQTCGFETATPAGRVWQSSDDEFKIKFFDVIRDGLTGGVLTTPARIGHSTGKIDVSKSKFDTYTIPMRLIILLHEYSHKYRNPKIGLEISNEFGADINALYYYLGLGFSKIDCICVFMNVFLAAQTPGNLERKRKIMNYISRFELQEFCTLN